MTNINSSDQKPYLHYSPAKNWMNDPNGLVYYEGQFHMFYQYNPHDSVWGEMHWGHAVSTDGLSWTERGIALSPHGNLKHVFSGCAVVDFNNSSGLFRRSGGIILLYTGITEQKDTNKTIEHQYMAYIDEDTGNIITTDSKTILVNPDLDNFRDPKVIFHVQTDSWMMVLACGDHIRFYSSTNLHDWNLEDKFYPNLLRKQHIIECPNISRLQDNNGITSWVLIMSILNVDSRESETYYLTGKLNNYNYLPDSSQMRPIDSGHDFYAPQQWNQTTLSIEQTRKPLWIGWMNNWAYADHFPARGWNGIMSIVREISLIRKGDELYFSQKYIEKLSTKRTKVLDPLYDRNVMQVILKGRCAYEFSMTLAIRKKSMITIRLSEAESNEFTFIIDAENSTCSIDRSGSSFPKMKSCGLVKKHSPLWMSNKTIDVTIILDVWTIEIFMQNGTVVFSELLKWNDFPDLFCIDAEKVDTVIQKFNCWELGEG